ncbi:MAG: flagellar export chaperone FliS [Gammaproteobacteria bacterium]|nr:flagellar export chaperone FliS [Gammaproteobacteria bacterium]
MTPNALGQYRTVNAYGAANGDRLQLVLRMLDGAIDRIASARGHMRRQETAAKGEAIGRAIGLIDGLSTALDKERGGSIAANLESLYDYMMRRLVEANFRNDERRLDEVAELLGEIRSGWAELVRPAATTTAAEPEGVHA